MKAAMVHYHVWFNLKPAISEPEGLEVVSQFMEDLKARNEAHDAQLLVNTGTPPRSKLPKYHALVEFLSDEHFSQAMRNQAARGVHIGPHGSVTRMVTDFHVEVFKLHDRHSEALIPAGCEI